MTINHTIEQTAEALRQVRASGTEADVNRFLCAVERHHGTDHMRAARRLAGEIAEAKHREERAAAERLMDQADQLWNRLHMIRVSWRGYPVMFARMERLCQMAATRHARRSAAYFFGA